MILATSSDQHRTVVFTLLTDEVAIAVGLLIAVAMALVLLARRERQPDAGPRTLDTPPQSPAVAGLLVHTRGVPGEAAAATLVDLAARGVSEIIDMGGGTPGVRLRNHPATPLTSYEQRIVDLVKQYADDDGVAPAAALTMPDEEAARRWSNTFAADVRSEARKNGWVRSRYGAEVRALLFVTVAAAFVIAIWGYVTADKFNPDTGHPAIAREDLRNALSFVAIVIGVLDVIGLVKLMSSSAQRLTRAGRPVASAWLGVAEHLRADEQLPAAPPGAVAIWHRLLAYATVFGVAHTVQEQLPLGPESPTVAWSDETGRWRRVQVRYPKVWPPGWGGRPGELIKRGLVILLQVGVPIAVIVSVGTRLIGAGVLDDLNVPWWVYAIAVAVIVPIFAIGLRALLWVLVGLGTLVAVFGRQRVVVGRAVRVRPISGSGEHWVALDDGSRDEVVAYQVRIPHTIEQGDRVRLTVRPVTGEVRAVEVLNSSGTAYGPGPMDPRVPRRGQ